LRAAAATAVSRMDVFMVMTSCAPRGGCEQTAAQLTMRYLSVSSLAGHVRSYDRGTRSSRLGPNHRQNWQRNQAQRAW
jgi:hypothetical protein